MPDTVIAEHYGSTGDPAVLYPVPNRVQIQFTADRISLAGYPVYDLIFGIILFCIRPVIRPNGFSLPNTSSLLLLTIGNPLRKRDMESLSIIKVYKLQSTPKAMQIALGSCKKIKVL